MHTLHPRACVSVIAHARANVNYRVIRSMIVTSVTLPFYNVPAVSFLASNGKEASKEVINIYFQERWPI